MAIIKFNNSKNSISNRKRNKLARIISYITDRAKTCRNLIGGQGVNEDNALERMNTVKEYYNKSGGREYIHFCVSFQGKPDVYIVYDIASVVVEYYPEYQVVFAIHLNTDNTHIHFILNTVSVVDGHKFTQSKFELQNLKCYIDTIVRSFGLGSDSVSVYEEPDGKNFEDYIQDFVDEFIAASGSNNQYFNEYISEHTKEELIEPIIYDTPDLIEPIVFDEKSDLIEPIIFYNKKDSKND